MMNLELIDAYGAGWNARDADAILATFGSNGTYQDPTTNGPIGGGHLRGHLEGLWSAFPDLSFEFSNIAETGADSASFEWVMTGTNNGSMNGLPPSGKSVSLQGADFVQFADGKIRSVKGYFDSTTVPRQIGLNVVIQPFEVGPFRFGTSVAVQTGQKQMPGAFSITQVEPLDDTAAEKIRESSRATMVSMLEMDGFIGAVTANIGERMMTITAWDNADAPRQLMRPGPHAAATKGMMDGSLAKSGYTSVHEAVRVNPYLLRCEACGKMHRGPEPQASCGCGATLPDQPAYW